MRFANLRGADLKGARLAGAKLDGALFEPDGPTAFQDAILSEPAPTTDPATKHSYPARPSTC